MFLPPFEHPPERSPFPRPVDGGDVPELATVGVIARRLNVPVHRVLYVIATRRLEAAGKAGIARVFDDEAIEQIRRELASIDAQQGGTGGGRG